ncbi:hypothetical protein DSO57_1036223 [Entomophthora muscae]|uniref:Uncharacterized protein n=1 Tax=Entomophthora muscae TaxID=34485 RepID=A0ACC2RQ74_9FUNG|nr:hypothetical protein DSO57_1036223 [Entomophthora muscae]
MHESPLLLKLAAKDHREEGFFNFAYWIKENGCQFSNLSEFVDDHRYMRGGKVSHYTSRFNDKCGINPLRKDVAGSERPPWDINHLVVVTNSVCYSTCSLLVNSLQEFHNVTTFAYGGIRDRPATACSIQGGTVYNLEYLLDDLEVLGLNSHADAPKQLPTNSTFSFTIREAYSSKKFGTHRDEIKHSSSKSHHGHRRDHHRHKNHTNNKLPGSKHPIEKGFRPLEFIWNEATFHPAYPGKYTFLSPFQQWRQIADMSFSEN